MHLELPRNGRRIQDLINEANDVNPQNLAYLHDRICYFEGRPQMFCTQFDSHSLLPVEDKTEIIRLRKELKLIAHDQDRVVEIKANMTIFALLNFNFDLFQILQNLRKQRFIGFYKSRRTLTL